MDPQFHNRSPQPVWDCWTTLVFGNDVRQPQDSCPTPIIHILLIKLNLNCHSHLFDLTIHLAVPMDTDDRPKTFRYTRLPHISSHRGDFAFRDCRVCGRLCKMMAAKRAACEKAEKGLYHLWSAAINFYCSFVGDGRTGRWIGDLDRHHMI